MVEFIDFMLDEFLQNVVGGLSSQSVEVGMMLLLLVGFIFMVAAGMEIEIAVVIISPAVIAAAFGGSLPAAALGVAVIILGYVWAMIILAVAR